MFKWVEFGTGRKKDLKKDSVCYRYSSLKSGRIKFAICIGRDITDILGWGADDRIVIYQNKFNSMQLMLKKSQGNEGNKLHCPEKSNTFNVARTVDDILSGLETDNSVPVWFDLKENCLQVDLSKAATGNYEMM